MKDFIIAFFAGLVATLVAAGILYISPSLYSFFEKRDGAFLTVEIVTDNFGDLKHSKIIAINSSRYSFSPLNFHLLTNGNIVKLGIVSPRGQKSYDVTPNDTISEVLDAGEIVVFYALIEKGSISNDLEKLFTGNYSFIDSKGRVKNGSIKVRSLSEKQIEQYIYLAKWFGFFFAVVFSIFTVIWLIIKKRGTVKGLQAKKV